MKHEHQQLGSTALIVILSIWPIILFLCIAPFVKPKKII